MVLLVVISVLLSFTAVQTSLAKYVTNRINEKYDTTILVEKVDLSSLRNIELKNILILDHHQDSLISVNILSTSILSYKNIIDNNLNFSDIEIENGEILMKTYKGETSNNLTIFSRKFNTKSKKKKDTPFQLTSSSLHLKNVNFSFIDKNKREEPIVYYNNIDGYFDNLKIYETTVTAFIHDFKTTENHGIDIVNFKTNFKYSTTKMEFLQSEMYTENSNILADIIFDYNDGDLSNFTDKVQIDANINDANIALADVKKLYSEFGKNDIIHFKTKFNGTINDFVLSDIDLSSKRNSILKGSVHLQNILQKEKFNLDADIKQITSNYDHLKNLLPDLLGKNIPSSFEKVGRFTSAGKVLLTNSTLYFKLNTQSQIGEVKTDIKLTNIDNIDDAFYKGKIELIDFKLGKFVNDSLIGNLSMVSEVNGKGFKIDNLNTMIKGTVSKHQYKGYTYTNIGINGILKEKHFNGKLIVNDPNIQLEFKGLADLSGKDFIFDFNADVASADFYKLNLFTRDSISILKGKMDINLTGRNLDNLEGSVSFKDATYINQNDNYYFKDFIISSKITDSIREVQINSTDIINGSIKGDFKFDELKKVVKNSVGSLFVNYQEEEVSAGQYLDFNFNIHNKIIEVFFPEVKIGANSIIRGEIDSDENKLELLVKSPEVIAFDNIVENIRMQVDNKNPIYNTLLSVDKIDTKYYNVADVNMVNVTLNDTLFMRTDFIGGKEFKEKYNLSFYHTINENNQSVFGIKNSEILYKNNTWQINPNDNNQNKIVFDQSYKTFAIDNVNMVSGNQHVDLAGLFQDVDNKNIDLKFKNVNLQDITPVIDSVALDGKLNGIVNFKSVNSKTLPFVDVTINYFSINDDYYGDLTFLASADETIKTYTFETELLNSDLKSFYSKGQVDFSLDNPTILAEATLDKFKINAFSPLGKNVLTKIRGFASGNAIVSGLISDPDIYGEIILEDAGLALPYLNVNYNFKGKSKVKLYNQTFDFQSVIVEDNLMKTTGIMTGTITHREFKKWGLDLELVTDNLLILNTKETEESLYYGTGLISGVTTLRGFTDDLVIDVEGKTNPGTEFIIPLSDVSTVGQSKLIHFEKVVVNEDDEYKEIVFEQLKGLTINFKLNVTKDAIAEIVIDKISGSLLRGSGDGDLSLSIDTNGKFEMYGDVIVDNGEYQFKNIVNKDFIVKKGGTINWSGNPYDAELDIEAVYHTKANPSVLLDEIASSRKIDVDLITIITGTLSSPNLDFDIFIPNASSLVSSELEFKIRNEDDKLTQFISLLAAGTFSNQDKANFNSNAAIAGTLAQKASQLLTNMLVSENDNLQIGVTYDIGLKENVENVITDDQLGLEVSGRIADKVIVNGKVGVPVGSNTRSSVIGEVEIIVPLNEAETFRAKVYNRQNEIQFEAIEGEGYTQGVGFTYSFDFDNTSEFFNKIGLKKTEEEKKAAKKKKDSLKRVKKEKRRK